MFIKAIQQMYIHMVVLQSYLKSKYVSTSGSLPTQAQRCIPSLHSTHSRTIGVSIPSDFPKLYPKGLLPANPQRWYLVSMLAQGTMGAGGQLPRGAQPFCTIMGCSSSVLHFHVTFHCLLLASAKINIPFRRHAILWFVYLLLNEQK